jgi:glycosyltransferase involved in cell wall biosynthesis
MISKDKPRVSIGVPVFNGENYIAEALDSLRQQTFSDFELIISDNASTDRTGAICRAYAARDHRVHYFQNEKNLGAAYNYRRVFELSSGEYFKWAAHDDIHAPEFLARCVELLDKDISVVLCNSKTNIIDKDGKPYLNYIAEVNTDSSKPYHRFYNMINTEHWCYQVFGLFRSQALKMTPLIGPYSGSDRVLLAHLSLIGRVYEISEYLFFRREHPETSTNKYISNQERMVWFDPALAGQRHYPTWLKFKGYLNAINQTPLSPYERTLCYFQVMRMIIGKAGLRLKRKLKSDYDRSHLAVPVEGVGWR